jgi:hypothetical protein
MVGQVFRAKAKGATRASDGVTAAGPASLREDYLVPAT